VKSPMLCEKYEPGTISWGNGERRIVDPKIDGMRAIFINEDGEWRVCSRTGKPVYNVEHIIAELQQNELLRDVVLDGELWAGSLNATVSVCRTEDRRKDAQKVYYLAFDIIDLCEWDTGDFVTIQTKRKDRLWSVLKDGSNKVIPVRGWEAASESEVDELYADSVGSGFEGIIVKRPDDTYRRGRTTSWLKLKPLVTDEFQIVGFEEGENRLEGSLGAIRVDSGDNLESKVGTGLKDRERDWIWANQDSLLGKWVEIAYQGRGANGRLREPRFRGLRESQGGEYIKAGR